MPKTTEQSENKIIEESCKALQECTQIVDSLVTTCCIPERSPNMIELQTLISDMISTIKKIKNSTDNIKKCIELTGILGSKIGYLNVTCCASSRESKYQALLKKVMYVHRNMWVLIGHS